MIEFSGKRAFQTANTVTVYDFSHSRADAINRVDNMENLEGQTWTLLGLQEVVQSWKQQSVVNSDDRQKILLLITDGRPKPRTTASDAEGDTAEPGCIETMVDTDLRVCANGESPAPDVCRNQHCGDVNMETTDCCPGDQNPCTSDEKA